MNHTQTHTYLLTGKGILFIFRLNTVVQFFLVQRRKISHLLISFVCPPDDLPRKKSPQMYKPPTPEMLAYLDFSVSTTGILAGVKVSRRQCTFQQIHMSTCVLSRVYVFILVFSTLINLSILYQLQIDGQVYYI